jgi:flagellar biosynthesis protein FlhF
MSTQTVRTFKGRSMNEVLRQVKAEFGDDAIIVSSRQPQGLAGSLLGEKVVEVTAARAPAARPGGGARHSQVPRPQPVLAAGDGSPSGGGAEQARSAVPLRMSAEPDVEPLEFYRIKQDLREMKVALREMTRTLKFGGGQLEGEAAQHFGTLVGSGIGGELAQELLEEAEATRTSTGGDLQRALLAQVARRLPCAGMPQNRRAGRPLVIALVGATGAGKTSSLAKLLASREGFAGRRLGILSLDTRKMAALDQLRSLARLLSVPLEVAWRPNEIPAALERLSGCEVVLVDTPGAGPGRRVELEALKVRLEALDPQEIHLVLHAGLREGDQQASVECFKALGASRLLPTRLDECGQSGAVLELACRSRLPLGWLGLGPEIPGDLRLARPDRLAGWVLGQPESLGQGAAQ